MAAFSLLLASFLVVLPGPTRADILDAYLMDESLELALARSAAPAHISDFATVMVLRPNGYAVVHEGSNGFTCLVLRSFAGPGRAFDPRSRAPICYTPGAADGALAVALRITEGVAEGRPMSEILTDLEGDLAAGRIAASAPGDLAYMLSGEQWLNERVGRWLPHLMFYLPGVSHAELGANPFGSNLPVVVGGDTGHFGDVTVALDEDDFLSLRRLDREILDHASRPAGDREQDVGRLALDVYDWLGIRPGMVVADVFSGGGYNTHLLALALAEQPTSRVYSVAGGVVADTIRERFDLDFRAATQRRIQEAGLRNVTTVETVHDLPPAGVDAIVSIRNFHDYDVFGGDSRAAAVGMFAALAPGGILGIEEVATDRPGWDEETHRLNESVVIDVLTAAGFELVGRSHLLRDEDDDHSTAGFEVGRHRMDRYLLKFRKPAD